MPTLRGKPAGVITMRCPHCKRDTFKIMGKAPAGTSYGDVFTKAPNGYNAVECAACGEQYAFEPYK